MSDLIPNKTDIAAHLYALFDPAFVQPYPDAWIEIAYAHPATGGDPDRAKIFSAFELEQATEFAAAKNMAGYSVYVGGALRHGKRPPGRSSGLHVLAASHAWVDFDKAGDEARIAAILQEKGLTPAIVVTTGTTPWLRRHLYFRLDGAALPNTVRDVNTSLKVLLGTDAVQNADRLVRLAGTINYTPRDPVPAVPHTEQTKQERGYITELTTLHLAPNARAYTAAARQSR